MDGLTAGIWLLYAKNGIVLGDAQKNAYGLPLSIASTFVWNTPAANALATPSGWAA